MSSYKRLPHQPSRTHASKQRALCHANTDLERKHYQHSRSLGSISHLLPASPIIRRDFRRYALCSIRFSDKRGWISGLDALAHSEYARDLTTLSFCSIVFDSHLHAGEWTPNMFESPVAAFSRFPVLKHVRYCILPLVTVRGRWANDSGYDMHVWDSLAHGISGDADLSFQRLSKSETQAARFFR
jgi:hypothetical protein